MKIGISTSSFFNRVPTESAFELLRNMRVETTEVFLNTYSEYEKPFIDALAQRRGNINVHSVHPLGIQFEPELFSSSPRVRADAEIIFRKVCYAAYALGAKFYTFHGPIMLKNKVYDFDYDKLGARINQLIEIAGSYGVRVSYENVHWTYAKDNIYFNNILPQCPQLFTTFDIKQALQADIDYRKIIDSMDGRISTIHLCDYDGKNTTLPGKGKVNFKKLFSYLDKRRINANCLIEVYSKDYNDVNQVRESFVLVSDILAKMKKKK